MNKCAVCYDDVRRTSYCACEAGVMCRRCFKKYIRNFGGNCTTCRTPFSGKMTERTRSKNNATALQPWNNGDTKLRENIILALIIPTLIFSVLLFKDVLPSEQCVVLHAIRSLLHSDDRLIMLAFRPLHLSFMAYVTVFQFDCAAVMIIKGYRTQHRAKKIASYALAALAYFSAHATLFILFHIFQKQQIFHTFANKE